MDKSVESALRIIEGTGPVGAYIAAGIVGLVLAIIVIARVAGLFDNVRSEKQKTDFLGIVIAQFKEVTASEVRLRAEAERIEVENDALKDRQRELLTSVELMRAQLRRLIDLLTAVRDGKVPLAAIDAELAGLAK
ncbi:hypothetical protein ACSD7O_22295 [Methylorubrum extorquens]|uniref:hypothetical protein n=1 Tax=Methylorubrum extorquens TaxID=408 RepID=UPI003F60510A